MGEAAAFGPTDTMTRNDIRATTVVAVRRDGHVAIAGDGQITLGETIMKSSAQKVRWLRDGKVLAGCAGSAADALTLFEKFETKLDEYSGNLQRAAVELVRDWRTDRVLRRLEALLVVADSKELLVLSGTGDLIRPDDDVVGIGSGGAFALAAARALLRHTELSAEEIARQAIVIAASICLYTNENVVVEVL
jgi:ATP-dependent HslUV protease subunit HslV